ncbi:MAG: hypothetical protein KF760_14855 [Candidatus Eremiobacteraeota bacterium]|nr:hypothetical protein [Candidatus Eremiobacteraeota bacterium]MCW5869824.1 hypothetical protein [Candidatus Eremiobacteraeota bacterium]
MKIARAPQPQPGRSLSPKPVTPEGASSKPNAPGTPVSENDDLHKEATMKEFWTLLRSSRPGMLVGALAFGGVAAGLGAVSGAVGGMVGTTASLALGTAGGIGGGAGLGYLGLTRAPRDIRAFLLGFGGLVVGGCAGGMLARHAGAALNALAGIHGGLAGAAAGLIAAGPVGAVIGSVVQARKNLKEHPELYPNLLKAKTEAAKEENPKTDKK